MRFTTSLLILLIALSTVTKSCEKNRDEDIVHELDVSFELPASIDIYEGAEYAFKAKDGKLPEISDQFFLKKAYYTYSLLWMSVPTALPSNLTMFRNQTAIRFI
jgi:hypothetical protein